MSAALLERGPTPLCVAPLTQVDAPGSPADAARSFRPPRPRPIARSAGHKCDFRSLADFRVGQDELEPRRDR
jgi:hypothetical protein